MAVTNASGTQACVIGTEHTLATTTTVGNFVLQVNLTACVAGDVFEVRVKRKVLTGDTAETFALGIFGNDLGELAIIDSPPTTNMFSLTATIKQTAGVGRSIPWALIQIDG